MKITWHSSIKYKSKLENLFYSFESLSICIIFTLHSFQIQLKLVDKTKLISALWSTWQFSWPWFFTRSLSIDWISGFNRFRISQHSQGVDRLYFAHKYHWSNGRVHTQFVVPLLGLLTPWDVHVTAIFASPVEVVRFAEGPVRVKRRGGVIYPGETLVRGATQ